MNTLLAGKVTLITGASQGIGKALALGFAESGSHIILTARNREKLEDTRILVEKMGVRALVVPADIQKYDEIAAVIAQGIAKFGHIDILINNAGFSRVKPITKMRVEQFQDILATNVDMRVDTFDFYFASIFDKIIVNTFCFYKLCYQINRITLCNSINIKHYPRITF